MPWTCDTTCVILSRLSFATSQYLRVASYKSFLRLYILPFSVQSIELLMQTNSILSPSSGIIFSILLLLPDTYFSHKIGRWHIVSIYFPLLMSTIFQPSFRRTRESSLIILTLKILLSMVMFPSFTAYEYSPAGTIFVPSEVPLKEY